MIVHFLFLTSGTLFTDHNFKFACHLCMCARTCLCLCVYLHVHVRVCLSVHSCECVGVCVSTLVSVCQAQTCCPHAAAGLCSSLHTQEKKKKLGHTKSLITFSLLYLDCALTKVIIHGSSFFGYFSFFTYNSITHTVELQTLFK